MKETLEEAAREKYPPLMALGCEIFHNIRNWDINEDARKAFIEGALYQSQQEQGRVDELEIIVAKYESALREIMKYGTQRIDNIALNALKED
jgi:hypothetical protein